MDKSGSTEKLTNVVFDFIEQLDRQDDLASLLGAFHDLVQEFGFVGYCIGDPTQPRQRRPGRVWGVTWPDGWKKRFVDQNYMQADPVIHELALSETPFRWRDVRKLQEGEGARIMDEASEFSMNDGIGIPIGSPDGTVIGITMGTEHYELGRRDELGLHLASIYFHAKLERLRAQGLPRQIAARLTPRERECLTWVAAGKTDWEISQILNISQQTAHEHVQNALVKLNATTRAQAVAVALLTRQISV